MVDEHLIFNERLYSVQTGKPNRLHLHRSKYVIEWSSAVFQILTLILLLTQTVVCVAWRANIILCIYF